MGWHCRDIKVARQSLVLDASVGVKWFSSGDETSLAQALAIRDAHIGGYVVIVVPDLFFYEVANAITQKKNIPSEAVLLAVTSMFALSITSIPIEADLLDIAVRLSRQIDITIYDSIYIAVAMKHNYPLITANPRHQKEGLNCEVIPIEKWHYGVV